MSDGSRRAALRQATAPAHQALERQIGPLIRLERYRTYLIGLLAFREPLEDALAKSGLLRRLGAYVPTMVAPELRRDLHDIGVSSDVLEVGYLDVISPPETPPATMSWDIADVFGVLYVLEGSGLGAKVLTKDAMKLGLNENFGARHLKRQRDAVGEWRRFVDLLEAQEPLDLQRVARAATETFAAARRAMMTVYSHAA